MTPFDDSAVKIAEYLLQIKAIKLQPEQPFTWASGWKSPIYCDNRKTLSYPQIRTYIRQQYVDVINEQFGKPDVIAGVATGGIAQGALIAQDMGLPFVYVRSEAKKHGMTNMVEGVVEKDHAERYVSAEFEGHAGAVGEGSGQSIVGARSAHPDVGGDGAGLGIV